MLITEREREREREGSNIRGPIYLKKIILLVLWYARVFAISF